MTPPLISETSGPSFSFLSGGGEMGALMRAHDWEFTSLGSPKSVPSLLKTTVRLLLTGNPRLIERDALEEQYLRHVLPVTGKKLRILVVDDNVDAAHMLAMYLATLGHEVLTEHASKKALERARNELPDVCLLDIGLPEMDGNELARNLRKQRETAKVMLIAITGYGQEQDKQEALAAGFDHHLIKPVDVARLAALLARAFVHSARRLHTSPATTRRATQSC